MCIRDRNEAALNAWSEALKRDPENQKLAKRLSELKPRGSEPWLEDVPTEEAINAAIARRKEVSGEPGANLIYLLDDEVTRLFPDGSTSNVVTHVIHTVNQEGRDEVTQLRAGRGRGSQLMAAYAVAPDGRRIEAASSRNGRVRFRQLQVGSTVVLQFRSESKPEPLSLIHI